MAYVILDCYTDEPSGLGVPPCVGTYPRYIAGALKKAGHDFKYLTIDDLRALKIESNPRSRKTNIKLRNLSSNSQEAHSLLSEAETIIVVSGIHTPGKYLSAFPGTAKEASALLVDFPGKKVLTGPAAASGEGLFGGRKATTHFLGFDEILPDIEFKLAGEQSTSYDSLREIALLGTGMVAQAPGFPNIVVEIETAKGCSRKVPCSFCTEPLKNKLQKRKVEDVVEEVKKLNSLGVVHFRLGKQADFFDKTEEEMESLLRGIRDACKLRTLHIDNADPVLVNEEKVKLVVKYCTPGNVAALGAETFDPEVIKANNLHSAPEATMNAIRIINKYGAERGENGMPKCIPGINLLYGLKAESRETHDWNMKYLQQIIDEGLLLRRINIRQVVVFLGTQLERECGMKFMKKNKKYYWKWRNDIRHKIDNPLLQTLVPKGTILKDVFMEVHDGNHTFGRQFGTYPLIVGLNEKVELNRFYNIKVAGWMLRSIVGEVV